MYDQLLKSANKLLDIAALFTVAMMLVQILIVIFRYGFAMGVPWALDLVVYLFLLSMIAPALMVVLDNKSVRVDIFYVEYSANKKALLDKASLLFLLFPSMGYAAWSSIKPLLSSWALLESSPSMGGLPGYFLLKTALFLFFVSLAFAALLLASKKHPWDYSSHEDV